MAPPPGARKNALFVPSQRRPAPSNRLPPPLPGRAPYPPPNPAYAGPSASSSFGGSSTPPTGNALAARPSSFNGAHGTSTNAFRPPPTTGAPAPRRRASAALDQVDLDKKTCLMVADLMGLVKELGDDARDAKHFRFPLHAPADDLAAKYAEERARDAAERKAVLDEGHVRVSAAVVDLVRSVAADANARLSQDLEALRAEVRQLSSQPRAGTVPPAPSPAAAAAAGPAPPNPVVNARLDALEARQHQHEVSTRGELDQGKDRLATLEEAARKSVDPRVRPGSHSSPASPILAAAPPPPAVASKAEHDALKATVERLSQRVERDEAASAALGKRSSAEAPAADDAARAAKVQRVGASAEALDELSARFDSFKAEAASAALVGDFSQRVDTALAETSDKLAEMSDKLAEIEADVNVATVGSDSALAQALDATSQGEATAGRVGAVEVRLDAVEAKLEQATQDKADDMDLERTPRGAADGLQKLEKRLGELGEKVEAEVRAPHSASASTPRSWR